MKITASSLAFAFAAGLSLIARTGTGSDATTVQTAPATNLSETPAWADSFVDSVGIDAKYENRTYTALATQELYWSQIRHLRDSGPPTATFIAQMKTLGQHGVRHSIGMGYGFAASDLKSRLALFAPYVDFVEPANEADNVKHPNWAQMRSDQKNLWETVRSNKAWANIAVSGPSFANPGDHAALVGPLDEYEDFGALHNGTCNWNPGTDITWVSIDANTAKIRVTTRYKPIWTTETGYNDNLTRGCSITDNIIAKYLTRTSTERWLHGEPRTYFNVLVDDPKNVAFGNLGLLHVNGTPKAQFVALGNLVRLLADPGTAPKPSRVAYSINGATADVHHILLSRRDGTFDLLLYREMPCWDHFKHAAIAVPTETVGLTVPGIKHASLYKYNSTYSFSGSTLAIGKGNTLSLPVTDSISVVHIGF
jgi:hypothetical protein